MYIDDNPERLKYRSKEPVRIRCDECGLEYARLFSSAQRTFRKRGRHSCRDCVRKLISQVAKATLGAKPQCSREFWTAEKRQEHSEIMRKSDSLKIAHARMDRSGPKNGMFGKKMSAESRAKMSKSRTGKFGPNATAWKGGRSSFLRRLKGAIHERFEWYYRVFKRDGWTCQRCGSKSKIDAHHIEPLVCIVRKLCDGKSFGNDVEKMEWLLGQPLVSDLELNNGITLCRLCHRDVHENWGSHINPSLGEITNEVK